MELKEKSKGLGDTVSKITSALGIPECENCAWRRDKLNKKFPYKQKGVALSPAPEKIQKLARKAKEALRKHDTLK